MGIRNIYGESNIKDVSCFPHPMFGKKSSDDIKMRRRNLEFKYLDFEGKVRDIDRQIDELDRLSSVKGIDYSVETRRLNEEKAGELERLYGNLSGEQTVQVARHEKRPVLADYLEHMVKEFREMHGDKCYGDDRAIVCGFGRIGGHKVMVVGNNKRGVKLARGASEREALEYSRCYAGCPNPEGFRKALLKMKLAEKFGVPIVTLIDTPGAYPGIGAEERGQARAIAYNLAEMSKLRVPIVSVVIGEGGSGGALGIGVADRFAMLQFAYYSVASPEACAGILWRDGSESAEAAEALKLRSGDLFKMGLVDAVVGEPLGGAHRNHHDAIGNVKGYVVETLDELVRIPLDRLVEERYSKLRDIGKNFIEGIN